MTETERRAFQVALAKVVAAESALELAIEYSARTHPTIRLSLALALARWRDTEAVKALLRDPDEGSQKELLLREAFDDLVLRIENRQLVAPWPRAG